MRHGHGVGLEERDVFVTGSSQGIGRAAAPAFAAEGARVGVTYRHERARAERVVQQITAARSTGRAWLLSARVVGTHLTLDPHGDREVAPNQYQPDGLRCSRMIDMRG
jgi:NAD(P)-dependent dehydrogenase (short-subunit alcohol dehydrogenase family)